MTSVVKGALRDLELVDNAVYEAGSQPRHVCI